MGFIQPLRVFQGPRAEQAGLVLNQRATSRVRGRLVVGGRWSGGGSGGEWQVEALLPRRITIVSQRRPVEAFADASFCCETCQWLGDTR
jgi:hypothetical protein